MSGLLEDKFIRCFKFDQSSRNLCVGTKNGIRLIDYSNALELRCAPRLTHEKIYLLEFIPDTDILIYVPDEARKKLVFHNFRRALVTLEPKHYSQPIVRIKATKERIVVATENAIFIYSSLFKGIKLLRQIDLPGTISENVVDLSEHPVNSYVAYPNFDRIGHLIISDSSGPEKPTIIQAHDSALVAIAIDPNGRTVASASESGVLIKVNRTFNGECVYEFKRGVTFGISMTSLSFSKDAKFLCAHDTSGILKVYKLDYTASATTTGHHWFLEKFQSVAELILPENASNWFFHEDPFAFAKLPESSACTAISTIHRDEKDNNHLLVANTDGLVHVYSINTVDGGQCRLLKSFSIEDNKYVEMPGDSVISYGRSFHSQNRLVELAP